MFKVGQRVKCSEKDALGTIVLTDSAGCYPVMVMFDYGGSTSYTADGRYTVDDVEPCLLVVEEVGAYELLRETLLQLEYLSEKFGETGTSNALISRIKHFLNEA